MIGERRYQVVTWSDDIGADERMDYTTKADAVKAARSYKSTEEYAAVYDRKNKTAFVVFGNPYIDIFANWVTVKPLKGA